MEDKTNFSLNRNQFKYIVVAAMIIDHIAWGFVDKINPYFGGTMHFIGRLTGATMAYFVGEGYQYTRSVPKYQMRLGIFAIISWGPFVYFEYGFFPFCGENANILTNLSQSVIFTLFLGLTAIRVWESTRINKPIKVCLVVLICMASCIGDWAFMNVLGCLFVHVFRNDPKKKWTAFTLTYFTPNFLMITYLAIGSGLDMALRNIFQFGVLLAPIMLRFVYNGESGSKASVHKWFFYAFYPLHLLILGFLRWGF